MDKQQAAEKFGKQRAETGYSTRVNGQIEAFNAGWEARDAQSPIDANQADSEIRAALGALLDEIPPQTQDADWWHDGLTEAISRAEKAYFGIKDTTTPSGAASQPVDAIGLLKKHLPAFGDWYSSYKNIVPPKSFETLVSEYIRECDLSAPNQQARWMSTTRSQPPKGYEGPIRNVEATETTPAHTEWLYESGQQVFTREQVDEIAGAWAAKIITLEQNEIPEENWEPFFKEYMNTNYPETK